MTSPEPVPENVQLRYGSTQVFAQADVQSVSLRVLTAGDAFTVLGTEGDFYKVALPDGVTGFVYAHNLTGTHMPLTRREQEAALWTGCGGSPSRGRLARFAAATPWAPPSRAQVDARYAV